MLQILPPNIANLIAAGEVVQRPGSVVKELMENSIDAGASTISIFIEDSGRTLIQVIDDGCGMTDEEARLCFERHATSKIATAQDLEAIMTYGFRGEALASIAAVSEVTLKTRKQGSEIGSITEFSESNFLSQEAASVPEGTNISIRNLFYNIPARRKFLKSDKAEFRNIVTEFSRVAISHHNISFNLVHNSKDIFRLSGTSLLKKRIIDIIGKNIAKELVEASTDTPLIHINGFIGSPEEARKGLGNQYLFVNGRFFKSPYLHKAIVKSYENLIQEGYTPSYFLFFEIDPSTIDVNISPTKTEVKFENENQIFEILNAVTREALGKNAFTPSIDFDTEGAPEIPIALRDKYVPPPKVSFDPLFNPFEGSFHSPAPASSFPVNDFPLNDFDEDSLPSEIGMQKAYDFGGHSEEGEEFFEETGKCSTRIIQVQGKYLITGMKSGILIVNIYRARQRIFYEKYLKCLDESKPIIQATLFPQIVELDFNSFSLLTEHPGRLALLGFDIEADTENKNSVIIKGMPEGFPSDSDFVQDYMDDLVAILQENDSESMVKAQCRHNIALKLSTSATRKPVGVLSDIEAQALIDRLFACSEPDRSPDGKPAMSIISIEQLDKLL